MDDNEKSQLAGHGGQVIEKVSGYTVVNCDVCGFKHVLPLPTVEELGRIYEDDYYVTDKPRYIERSIEDGEWWNLVYSDRYDTFETLLGGGRRRMLDIGCGPGFFLKCGLERGWSVVGLEPSIVASTHAISMGIEVKNDFLHERHVDELGKFDAINMSEVLEHVPDPAWVLGVARRMMCDSGMLCVVVPNDYSPFQQALISRGDFRPWWVCAPHHINYFDRSSLESLIKKSGFEVIEVEATFPIDMFLLMGENYVGNDSLGRQCHSRRKEFELNLYYAGRNDLKRRMYKQFAELGVGREIVMFARVA